MSDFSTTSSYNSEPRQHMLRKDLSAYEDYSPKRIAHHPTDMRTVSSPSNSYVHCKLPRGANECLQTTHMFRQDLSAFEDYGSVPGGLLTIQQICAL